MKHLGLFSTAAAYEAAKSNLVKPWVALTKDDNAVHYSGTEKEQPQANAGDIVYKTSDGKFKAAAPTEWSASLGTAVGVCVIPTAHNVYGDGSCAILSLTQVSKVWGGFGTDIPSIANKTMIGCVGHDNNGNWTPDNEIDHTNTYGFICSDAFTEVPNPFDPTTGWQYNDEDCHIASPYNADGSRNAVYYQTTSPLTEANATADFDGVDNTSKIIEALGDGDYAAKWTASLQDGDLSWYLPACGELAYIMPRFTKINAGLTALSASVLGSSNRYWSSSEYSGNLAWNVRTDNGTVGSDYGEDDRNYVRGFARVLLSV